MKNLLIFLEIIAATVNCFGQTKNYGRAETAVMAGFKKFIEVENQGDSLAVRKMVWNSRDLLFIATGKADANGYVGFGTENVMRHFELLYQLHIHIDPDWDQVRVAFLSKDVARLFVPAGLSFPNRPTPNAFYLVTEWVRRRNEWMLASNVAFPVPH
ncbi:MAG TPA: hypothetical protein VL727_26265 [Puia sp.]|jgi:hypothetical protein|nr:hypothetical protein [Puia sp.]